MDNHLAQLTAALPPPPHTHHFAWAAAETRCGTALPADYKALLDSYGPVGFHDFVWLLFPGDHPHLSLCEEGLRIVGEYLPQMDPDIDTSRYQAWGITDNGDYCLWDKTSPDPDDWSIALTDTGLNYWDHFPDLNVTALLVGLAEHTVQSSVLPVRYGWPQTPSVNPIDT